MTWTGIDWHTIIIKYQQKVGFEGEKIFRVLSKMDQRISYFGHILKVNYLDK